MPIAASLLPEFDHVLATPRRGLERVPDNHFAWRTHPRSCEATLTCEWSFRSAGRTLFTLPRAALIRMWILIHTIHHRPQPGLYPRLLDVRFRPSTARARTRNR